MMYRELVPKISKTFCVLKNQTNSWEMFPNVFSGFVLLTATQLWKYVVFNRPDIRWKLWMEFKPVNVWEYWNSRILSLNMVASKEADKKLIYILLGFLTWKFRVFRLGVLYFLVLWMLPIYTKFLFSFNLWKICFRIVEPNCNLLRRDLFCYFMVPNTPIYWKNHCWIWKSLILARDLQELL